jgi:hypothetical protein
MNKTSEILKGPYESPRKFYEHSCETFCLYTYFDLEAMENQKMINASFAGQSQGDIRQ